MSQSDLALAEAYYSAMQSHDYDKIGSYLDNNVKYVDPNWPLTGKDKVFPVAKKFSDAVSQLKTVAKFSNDGQVMIVHDVFFKGSEAPLRSAALMTFSNGLIQQLVLICNPNQHMDICKAIFS